MIGIYKITNLINNKIYIGQSWDCKKRWNQHKNTNRISHLKSALTKYNINNFSFEILIEFKDGPFTQKYLDKFEDMFISQFNSYDRNIGYNKRGGGSKGKMSEDTKIKMSISQTGSKHPGRGKGKKRSEEFCKMKSIAMIGNQNGKGWKPSKETKKKISESRKGHVVTSEVRKKISEGMKGKSSKKNIEEIKRRNNTRKKNQIIKQNKLSLFDITSVLQTPTNTK